MRIQDLILAVLKLWIPSNFVKDPTSMKALFSRLNCEREKLRATIYTRYISAVVVEKCLAHAQSVATTTDIQHTSQGWGRKVGVEFSYVENAIYDTCVKL